MCQAQQISLIKRCGCAYYDCVILLKILQGKQVLVCNDFLILFCYLTLLLEIYLNGFSFCSLSFVCFGLSSFYCFLHLTPDKCYLFLLLHIHVAVYAKYSPRFFISVLKKSKKKKKETELSK